MITIQWRMCFFISILSLLGGCDEFTLNNPYPDQDAVANVYYSDFSEPPRTLDPARSYTANEAIFTAQIYEPPLQYHYLMRPYKLIPLTAQKVPTPVYLDINGKPLPPGAPDLQIAYSQYNIQIKPAIFYQPHPAFAKDNAGKYVYHQLTPEQLHGVNRLSDFPLTGTRELTADDYVYGLKRLANPLVQSPILGFMEKYIVGLEDYSSYLQKKESTQSLSGQNKFLDLRADKITGVDILDRYTYRITVKGKYPQFIFWLAMPFFSPIPWEADKFYSQAGMKSHNITFDWYPIGTGPYMLTENNPNSRMVLQRNPFFHYEVYPSEGAPDDLLKGYLEEAGKPLPFIDTFIFQLETESIPRWNKFLQGYYDKAGVSTDSFNQAIKINTMGKAELTKQMKKQGIQLQSSVASDVFYLGFNMLDDVVGGNSARTALLRQAIGITVDYEEYVSIFLNGRGMPAQGPIPHGILGYKKDREGMNPYVYQWNNNHLQRKSLEVAKQLLKQAGYPNGVDPKTHRPLILNLDTAAGTGPDEIAQFDWMRKQFAKLGVVLNVRATQFNRLQEKLNTGNVQIFFMGWEADYPDPENFLFLLYGPNGKVHYGGENITNYTNANYDALFRQMKDEMDEPKRLKIIDQMLEIIRRDSPAVWAFHRKNITLSHQWSEKIKQTGVLNNTFKYMRIDPYLRAQLRTEWNPPLIWPLFLLCFICLLGLLPVVWHYWKSQHQTTPKLDMD